MARGFNSDNIMDFNKHVGYISELIPGWSDSLRATL